MTPILFTLISRKLTEDEFYAMTGMPSTGWWHRIKGLLRRVDPRKCSGANTSRPVSARQSLAEPQSRWDA